MENTNYLNRMQGLVLDNRYKIEAAIGNGGMAEVYKGKDLLLDRTVAIKILHQSFSGDNDFVERFKREAQAAGKLSHPNIVNMYDVGYDQGHHYIIMEYVDGETLKDYIKREGRLSIESSTRIAAAIGEGLEHAHAMGIVHCDIKPHNILITPNGRVKVTDFGIARAINSSATLMYTTSVMGSVHYLSPEQAGGKAVDGSTDIYSLGVVLYEMLTGRVPYEGETAISIAIKHVKEKLTPPTRYNPNIPPLLEGVIMKALEKNKEDRYQSIGDFIADLRLSQGFVAPKGPAQMPFDFATQAIPTVAPAMPSKRTKAKKLPPYKEEADDKMGGFLYQLTHLPQKYIIGGILGLFIVAFLMAFLSFGNFWSNATVVVPNVVGKQVQVAKNILDDHHLRASISEVSNPTIPAGQVISMNPEPGAEVKEQRSIHLVVSKGAGELKVPDLKGLTLEQARAKLTDLGLAIGKITAGEDKNLEEGLVISQSPNGATAIAKGSHVDLVINKKAAKQVAVPNLVGTSLAEARKILIDAQFAVAQVNGDMGDGAIITAQQPAPGTTALEGTGFVLTTELKKADDKKASSSDGDNTKRGTIDITVPAGNKTQHIKIIVVDDNGRRAIYDQNHQAGDRIVRDVKGVGAVHIEVYLNNALVQDQAL